MREVPQSITGHFRNWVPYWLKVSVAFSILIPTMLINGAYIGSSVDISGYLGVLSEDINMAYYITSVGMAISYPIVPYVKKIATSKTIILTDLLLQVILSFICANTNTIEIIIFCSFWIGYLKGFALIEVMGVLNPVLSPSGTRNEFYTKFYPIALILGQLSLVMTAELAYQFQWMYMYYLLILLLLAAMFLVVLTMQYGRRLFYIPWKEIDWLCFFLITICVTSTLFILTYGKVLDWYSSPRIIIATFIVIITALLIPHRLIFPPEGKPPFLDITILKNRSSITVYILSFILMFFVSFSFLTSLYVTNILQLGSTKANELYMYMIPGILTGGLLAYYAYRKTIRMMWLIFSGFACFTVAIAILYFRVDPKGLYSDLYLPIFLRGMGMLLLFVAFAIYGIQGLRKEQTIYNGFFMIMARSGIAPAVGSCILSNWMYYLQQKNTVILSYTIDEQNPLVIGRFNSYLQTALNQGWSYNDAHKIATNYIYSTIQIQASMVSIKTILGWMLILGLIVLVGIVLYFLQFKPVRLIFNNRNMDV